MVILRLVFFTCIGFIIITYGFFMVLTPVIFGSTGLTKTFDSFAIFFAIVALDFIYVGLGPALPLVGLTGKAVWSFLVIYPKGTHMKFDTSLFRTKARSQFWSHREPMGILEVQEIMGFELQGEVSVGIFNAKTNPKTFSPWTPNPLEKWPG